MKHSLPPLDTLVRLLAILALGLPAAAQSYQTNFGEVRFDRGKPPATWHGVTQVDTASGALDIDIPLGPGIGARALKWVPTFKGHWAPLVTSMSALNAANGNLLFYTYQQTVTNGGMGLEPGFLRLVLGNFQEDNTDSGASMGATDLEDGQSYFRTPDGYAGSFLVAENADLPNLTGYYNPLAMTGTPASRVNPAAVAADFGFPASRYPIAPEITGLASNGAITGSQFVRLGQEGALIIGLAGDAAPPATCYPISQSLGTGTSTPISYPGKFLVVRGDLAYEYSYASTQLSNVCHLDSSDLDQGVRFFKWGFFTLTSIRNRKGDAIVFSSDPDNSGGYTADWRHQDWQTGTGQSIHVGVQLPSGLAGPRNLTVSYLGSGPQPSFQVTNLRFLGSATGSGSADADPTTNMAADSVTDLGTQQTIGFTYSPAQQGQSDTYVLSSVTMPGRTITYNWLPYQYFRNLSQTPGYANGHYPANLQRTSFLPNYAWGVAIVIDADTTGSGPAATRWTTHTRQIPQPDLADMWHWQATAHTDLVTHPDGSATVYRFVEPVNDGTQGIPGFGASPQAQIQALASLKHQVAEVREFESQAAAQADLVRSPAPGTATLQPLSASGAFRAEIHDGFDLCDLSNPAGQVYCKAVPYATHQRTWIPDCGAFQETSLDQWDPTTDLQWQMTRSLWDYTAAPALNSDLRSARLGGPAVNLANPTSGRRTLEQRSYGTDPALWHWGRVKQNTRSVVADNGPGHDPNIATGLIETPEMVTFDGTYDRVDLVTQGPLTRTFTYGSSSPESLTQPAAVTVTLSGGMGGAAGVARFGYDPATGFLDLIQPLGASWSHQQTPDGFGAALARTDENGVTTGIAWDAGRRLTGITPPAPEIVTGISYPDPLTVVYQRGLQYQEFHFNGFGERVLENRTAGSSSSYRLSSYDAMGRKLGESIWLPGTGDPSQWAVPNLLQASSQQTQTGSVCTQWEYDPDIRGKVCIESTPVYTTTTLPALHPANQIFYDPRGRVIKTIDPDNVVTQTAYPNALTRTVVVDPGGLALAATFTEDCANRLCQVVDALGQTTQYGYDRAGRLSLATQTDPKNPARTQARRWLYDDLGRLTQLVQPESGTTTYQDFDANGKAWTTIYGDGSAAPRKVSASYDPLGRPVSLSSGDGTVAETFTYGENAAGHGLANNRLALAAAGGVGRSLVYGGLNGRLSGLTRTVDGFAFEQAYTYTNYGSRQYTQYPSRTQPGLPGAYGSTQNLPWDEARALPANSSLDALVTYLTYDPVSWALSAVQSPMTQGTAQVNYGYRTDQVQVASIQAVLPAWLNRTWGYSYDAAGRLGKVVGSDSLNTPKFIQDEEYYTFDALGRLTAVLARDPWDTAIGYANRGLFQSFSYDAFGNRTASSTVTANNWAPLAPPTTVTSGALRSGLANGVVNMSLSATAPELLKNQLPAAFANGAATGASYDAQGNLTTLDPVPGDATQTLTLGYDALARVTSASYGKPANAVAEWYFHDDEGLRMKIVDSAGNTRYNIYDDARRLVAQYTRAGTGPLTWKKDIVYAGARELGEISPGGKAVMTVCDHLGSPRFQWDGASQPVQQKFLPFGELLDDPTTQAKFAKGFTNHEQTDASGLIYMQARFYLPGWGRFASPDPARDQHTDFTQSWNIYSYVMNSPVLATDPTGMQEATEKRTVDTVSKTTGQKSNQTQTVTDTKSWVGNEHKQTDVVTNGNATTTTTKTTGDSATVSEGVTLRGNSGFESTSTTVVKDGALTSTVTETHTEGTLNVKAGGSKEGLGAGASTTAIEHGKSWTGAIKIGPVTLNMPSFGVKWGIGVGAKVNLGLSDGRVGLSVKAGVGESLTLSLTLPSISFK